MPNGWMERAKMPAPVPLLLKIAPDLDGVALDGIGGVVLGAGIEGIIVSNTTLARPGPFGAVNQAGGLSGRPLQGKLLGIF